MKNLTLILAVIYALGLAPIVRAEENFQNPSDWVFDRAKLGQGFAEEFIKKIDLVPPCDIDPINEGARSVAFFTAKPCRGPGMTDKTTVVVFTSPAITREETNPPVTALAWLGGTFMNTRSNFPVKVGASDSEADQLLGKPSFIQYYSEGNRKMAVGYHGDSIYTMRTQGPAGPFSKVVGYVVGDMPPLPNSAGTEDEEHEEWPALFAAWFQFTQPVQDESPTPPEQPEQPGNPTHPGNPVTPEPAPITDPALATLVQSFMSALLQRVDEKARFQTLIPLLHPSLIRKDQTDFAPGIREYPYRRALKNAPFYIDPVSIEKVQRGSPTTIGTGASAETGRIDKFFLRRKTEAGGGSAPLHVFIPTALERSPSILNFGSL